MDRSIAYNCVILVQAALPDPAACAQLNEVRQLAERGDLPILVFFHAGAAALEGSKQTAAWTELSRRGSIELAVCQAARARRVDTVLPEPFRMSTLTRFWAAVTEAGQLAAPQPGPVRNGGVLIRVSRAPADELESREWLELVLAAASLDLDVVVLFEGRGLSLLSGNAGPGWLQLRDHGLARMVTSDPDTAVDALMVIDSGTLSAELAKRTALQM